MTRTPEDVRADKVRELWGTVDDHHGPLTYMAKHRVAANLLMGFVILGGFVALGTLVVEVFPEFSLDRISISVPYPGATPDDIEESILLKIEEQLESVTGIDEMTSTAAEGMGSVQLQLELGEDVSATLDVVQAELDQIITFPVDAERPEIREVTNRQSAIKLAIFGDVAERTLKEIAYRTEDALSELDAVSFVETSGIRQYEISIEIDQSTLRALGLTLGDIARVVRQGSLDLSAGSIETREEQVRVRTLGQNYEQQDFESIVVISLPDGTVVRLGDIATVVDGFEDADLITRYNGQPAALVEVYRTSDEHVLEIVDAINIALEDNIVPGLPEGVSLEVWQNDAELLGDRLQLMGKNALIGLILVLVALALFLEQGLALWVAAGIVMSFIGTLVVMVLLGVSINIMSTQAFILAIGIVVDDAIVVGENIYSERERGVPGLLAAVRGVKRISVPVVFAVLTTIAAFSPLLFAPGPPREDAGVDPDHRDFGTHFLAHRVAPHPTPSPLAPARASHPPEDRPIRLAHACPGIRRQATSGLRPGAAGTGTPLRHEGARYRDCWSRRGAHLIRCARASGIDSSPVFSRSGRRQRRRRPRDAGRHLDRAHASDG